MLDRHREALVVHGQSHAERERPELLNDHPRRAVLGALHARAEHLRTELTGPPFTVAVSFNRDAERNLIGALRQPQ